MAVDRNSPEHWVALAADRGVLADLLASLRPEQLAAPSLCAAWSVRDVAAHLLAMATVSKPAALAAYLRTGCDLDAANDALLRAAAPGSDEELVAAIRATAEARLTPPGLKAEGVFCELVTHLGDIALATDRTVELPDPHLVTTLAYLARRVKGNTRFTVTRHGRRTALDGHDRIAGLRLAATDVAWSFGDGPAVRGPALALIAALAGRAGALDRLAGDGVAVLHDRAGESTLPHEAG